MSRTPRDASATPATSVLEAAGVSFTVLGYPHRPGSGSYGNEAAAALGVDASRVFKTLMVDVDGTLTVAVVPVSGSLDLKALAGACRRKRAVMADASMAERRTGYVLGGISPLGQRQPSPVVIDTSALEFGTVLVSAGRRGLEIELSPGDLVRVTGATVAPIASFSRDG